MIDRIEVFYKNSVRVEWEDSRAEVHWDEEEVTTGAESGIRGIITDVFDGSLESDAL